MIEEVKKHLKEVESFSGNDIEAIENFRLSYAGKKGILNELFAAFRAVPNEEKKAFGQALNTLKTAVNEKVILLQSQLKVSKGVTKI